jgi:hypothetical protein
VRGRRQGLVGVRGRLRAECEAMVEGETWDLSLAWMLMAGGFDVIIRFL